MLGEKEEDGEQRACAGAADAQRHAARPCGAPTRGAGPRSHPRVDPKRRSDGAEVRHRIVLHMRLGLLRCETSHGRQRASRRVQHIPFVASPLILGRCGAGSRRRKPSPRHRSRRAARRRRCCTGAHVPARGALRWRRLRDRLALRQLGDRPRHVKHELVPQLLLEAHLARPPHLRGGAIVAIRGD
eukprot:scaffold1141_cov128-Isochrysis_galbana.AAC.18